MVHIDLNDLSKRESERVEWKENVADIDDIIKTAVAFANDYSNLGGGYIVCGAKESTDEHGFQKLVEVGLDASTLKKIEGKFFADLREKASPSIVPTCEELPLPNGRRILVLIVPATGYAHNIRTNGKDASTYYVRIGRETREAKNELLRELLIKKGELEYWDKRLSPIATIDDIDLLAFRSYIKEMGLYDPKKSLEDFLSAKEKISAFTPPLFGNDGISGVLRPRNFSLLMFGKNPLEFFEGAYTVFSVYQGNDRSDLTSERHELTGTIIEQARKALQLLNTQAYTVFDKTDKIPNQLKYPVRALQEAVVNSLVHRDYEINQPTRITVFSNRIEIYSPGGLPRTINLGKFLKGQATSFWRNQTLAYFFNKLQLAQAEGQGIPTILRVMKEEGCPSPKFDVEENSLTCVLPAHPRQEAMKVLNDVMNEIIFGRLNEGFALLRPLLRKDPNNHRAIDLLCQLCNLAEKQNVLLDFILKYKIDFDNIPPSTLINIADTLSAIADSPDLQQVQKQLSKLATLTSLEEKEAEKVVITLRKLRKSQEVIDYVNNLFQKKPNYSQNVVLLASRARSTMDLAKSCINTGRNSRKYNISVRAKAWANAREYLANVEKDLRKAMSLTHSTYDREYISKDIEFMNKMKDIINRPRANSQ